MPLFRRSSIPWDRRFPQPAFPPTDVLFFPPSALAVLPSTLSLRFFGARRVYITRLPRQRGFDSIRFITRSLQLESGQSESPIVSLVRIIGTRGSVSRKNSFLRIVLALHFRSYVRWKTRHPIYDRKARVHARTSPRTYRRSCAQLQTGREASWPETRTNTRKNIINERGCVSRWLRFRLSLPRIVDRLRHPLSSLSKKPYRHEKKKKINKERKKEKANA